MKLYFPISHYTPDRWHVFPLLRPFIKGGDFTDVQRKALYGVSDTEFEFTPTLTEADVCMLTMSWNYYERKKITSEAIAFIKDCDALGKKVLAINIGDFGVRMPYFNNLYVLRYGGYRSKFSSREYVLPPQIKDPLVTYYNTLNITERAFQKKPVIGFCGHADVSWTKAVREIFATAKRNIQFYLGMSTSEPQQLLSTSWLRAQILGRIQKSTLVTSNFIWRNKYRAGVKQDKEGHKTTLEFYDNIQDSDYVICVRGVGNFSIRFYEAMAMGRIPVLIDTDCALPFDREITWQNHMVWVKYNDRFKVAEKVAAFHSALSESEFINLQYANRKLWVERLTLKGFFQTFIYQHKPFLK